GAGVPQIIGADDGGVAPGIAAAEPTFLQHRNVGDAVLLGEVVGGGQAVAAATDDDHIIVRLRLGAAPGLLPALVIIGRVAGQREDGVAGLGWHEHQRSRDRTWRHTRLGVAPWQSLASGEEAGREWGRRVGGCGPLSFGPAVL